MIIDFLSVFEATRGLALLRFFDPDNEEWGVRDHKRGKLQFKIDKEHEKVLKQNGVGYIVISNEE
jgi:hypothetical protein